MAHGGSSSGTEVALATAFATAGSVDVEGFFAVMGRCLTPPLADLHKSPFAGFVFAEFAGHATRVPYAKVQQAVRVVKGTADGLPRVPVTKDEWRMTMLDATKPPALIHAQEGGRQLLGSGDVWRRFCQRADADEVFARYDVDCDGKLDRVELLMMTLTIRRIMTVFAEVVPAGAHTVDADGCHRILQRLGLGSIMEPYVRFMFDKINITKSGALEVFEMVQAVCRMLRPVVLRNTVKAIPGWPGWACFRHDIQPNVEPWAKVKPLWLNLRDEIDKLETGDVVLMKLTDDLARYFSFAQDCMWTHAAVVVKHETGPRLGAANIETQSLLDDAPFRWGTHRFCSPRYCRCYASASAKGAIAKMKVPLSRVELLEATGQGVHVYNLAARLFTGFNGHRTGTVAIRRLKRGAGRDDVGKVEDFITQVRGHLYHVTHDDGMNSFHCAQLAAAFYKHMGWLAPGAQPDYEYQPNDFAEGTVPLASSAAWGPLEFVRDEWGTPPLPLPLPKEVPKVLAGGSRFSMQASL